MRVGIFYRPGRSATALLFLALVFVLLALFVGRREECLSLLLALLVVAFFINVVLAVGLKVSLLRVGTDERPSWALFRCGRTRQSGAAMTPVVPCARVGRPVTHGS